VPGRREGGGERLGGFLLARLEVALIDGDGVGKDATGAIVPCRS